MSRRTTGVLLVIVSALSFGVMPIFARVAYASGTDPFTLLFLRFAFATPIMFGLCAVTRTPLPRGKGLLASVGLGAVLYVGQSLCYFLALTVAPASLVALLLYLYPGLVAIGASVFFHERFTLTKGIALALAVIGAVLMIGFVSGGSGLGVALGIGASVIYSVYIMLSSRLLRDVAPLSASTIVIAATAVVYAIIALTRGPAMPVALSGWLIIAAMAVVSTVIAIGAFFAGLERLGPVGTSTLSSLEPATAVALAVVLLGEPMTILKAVGAILILTAVILIARAGRGERVPAA
jgi:drug/metabolite transporter (DMT)-like permease